MEDEQTRESRFQTVNEFLRGKSFPTPASIRWWIHYDRLNFATRCVKRVGAKILIDTKEWESWVLDCDEEAKAAEKRKRRK